MFSMIGELVSSLLEGALAFLSIIGQTANFFTNAQAMLPTFLIPSFAVSVACLIVLAILKR